MRQLIVLEEGPTSWGAFVPGLPGCVAVGASCEEALRLIREAIPVHLEAMRAAGEALPEPSDAGYHRRRLAERLQDPEFRAAYVTALARTELAARVAEVRERIVTAGLEVGAVDEALAAAREEAEHEIAEAYRRGYAETPQEDWIGAAGLELFGAAAAAERRAELIECLEYLADSLAALQAREEGDQTVPWDELRGILAGRAGSVDDLLAWRREEATREDASREDAGDASH